MAQVHHMAVDVIELLISWFHFFTSLGKLRAPPSLEYRNDGITGDRKMDP